MTAEELIEQLTIGVRAKTLKDAALDLGVSSAYLHDVINGRRDPGKSILQPLGLRKVVTYETK